MNIKNNFVTNYISSAIQELKKVSWPKRNEIIRLTIMVIISVALAVVVVMGIDYFLTKLISWAVK